MYSMTNNFMKKYQSKTNECNYVLVTKPGGKFLINDSDKKVVDEIHKYVQEQKEKNIDFGLAEGHTNEYPELLYYDVDLKTNSSFTVSDKFIENLLTIFISILREYIQEPNLESVVTYKEESSIKIDDYYKFGLHIYFPFICLLPDERLFIYNKIIDKVSEQNIFGSLDLFDSDLREIIDYRVIKNNFIIKFECNKTNQKRYDIVKIFDENINIADKTYDFKTHLSIRKNIWLEEKIISKLKVEIPQSEKPRIKEHSEIQKEFSYDDVKSLLDLLSEKRADDYTDWVKVGLCLHNISSSDEMLKLWSEWSKKSMEKYKKTDFKKEWKKFKERKDGLHFGSLVHWASKDSPEGYAIYENNKVVESIKNSMKFGTNPFSVDIAKILYEKFYKKRFICSNIKQNTWYEYKDHLWCEMHEGNTLYNEISNLYLEYLKQDIELDKKAISVRTDLLSLISEEEKSRLTTQLNDITNEKKKLQKVMESLKRSSFKRDVFGECKNLFYDRNFNEVLNENRNLLVFKNGVYDLSSLTFRDGEPSDFMSLSTNIDFLEYDSNNPDIIKVYEIFSQIHPNKEILTFFFNTLALGLCGYKREQKLDIWTGVGSNGKSITVDFISASLGEYFYSPSITMFTRKRGSSSNATPDLIKLKGVRIAVMQEPEFNDTLHTSMMKQLTGGDWIEGRQLYSEPIKFKPQLSLFMACNDLPKIPSSDGGTWRRIRVTRFKSKFVHNPTQENEYKLDPFLQAKIHGLSVAFMSILIYHYYKLQKSNKSIKEPKEVLSYTKEYQKDNDIIQEFIDEHVEETKNPKDHLGTRESYSLYTDWIKESYPSTKPLSINDFKRQLETRFGELQKHKKGWQCYKIKCEIESSTTTDMF